MGLISGNGRGEATIKNAKLLFLIQVYQTNGKPQVRIESTQFSVQDLHINLIQQNVPRFILDILVGILKPLIKNIIENETNKQMGNEVSTRLNAELAKMPTFIEFGNFGFALDYSFTRNPLFLPNNIVSGYLRGEFFNLRQRVPSDFRPMPLPDFIAQSDKMIQVILSEFLFSTSLETLHKMKLLDIVITDKMIPEWSPIRLNSQSWALILPGLQRTFPNHELQLRLFTTETPVVNIRPQNASIVSNGEMHCFAIDPNTRELKLAFVLTGTVTLNIRGHLERQNIMLDLLFMKQTSSVKHSNIGEIYIEPFNYLINMLFDKGLIPHLNDYLKKNPLPLPTILDFELVSPEIQWDNHYLRVLSDLRYIYQI